MAPEELDSQLLARYLADECSAEEQKRVKHWIDDSKENAEQFKEFEHIWRISETEAEERFDANEEWHKLNSRIREEKENHSGGEAHLAEAARQRYSIHSASQRLMRYAAIFLVVGFIGFLSYQNFYDPEPKVTKPALREISTDNGQRVNLKLSDGSKVLLNAGSTLKLPQKFEPDVREVFLKGEAYFNITENPDKPFLVHSRGAVIRVLGTSFTVRSYKEDDQVRVVVKEGRVVLDQQKEADEDQTVLTANEMGQYHIPTNNIQAKKVEDMQLYFGWIGGYLKFRNTKMDKVATELERRYGVRVTFDNGQIKDKTLTAILKGRSIRSVLDVITMSLDIKYRLDGDHLIFYK